MNRDQLRAALDELGVDPRTYRLSSSAESDVLVLERSKGGWAVFYSERGNRNDERWFPDEAHACANLLERVRGDPTTRRPTHVPLPEHLAAKARSYPEHSMNVVRVVAMLKDGRVVPDVFVSGGEVVKVGVYPIPPGGAFRPLPFGADDIEDIQSQP